MATVAFSLDGETVAVIRQFAKDAGYPSTSSALRRIVAEWVRMKAERAHLAQGAPCECEEEARADAARLLHSK